MSETFTGLEIKIIKEELVKGLNPHQIYLKLNRDGCQASRKTIYNYINKLKVEDELFSIDKEKAKKDLWYHNKYVMNFDKVTDIHKEWRVWFDKFKASDKKVGLFLVPRDCFKSTFFTIGASSQIIGNEPNSRILIMNAILDKAKEFLGVIELNIRANPKYKYVYGDLYGHHLSGRRRNWTTMKIQVQRDSMILADPTVAIAGVKSAVAGKHVEWIFWDDLNNQLNVDQESVLSKIIDNWKLSNALLVPEGKGLIIMTRWKDDDVAGWVIDNIPEDIMVFWRGCRNKDGKKYFPVELPEENLNATPPKVDDTALYFPKRLTEKFLAEQRRKLGSYLFNCQYENNPLPEGTRIFKEKYFKPHQNYFKNPYTYFIVDPAQSKKDQSSDTGIIILSTASEYAKKSDGTKFVRNKTMINRAYKRKVSISETIDWIFELEEKWTPLVVWIEDEAYQKALQVALELKMRIENHFFNADTFKLPRGIKKDTRIRGLEPFYEDNMRPDGHRLYHYYHIAPNGERINYCEVVEKQLKRFPVGKEKDLIDALANFFRLVVYPSPEHSEVEVMHPLIKKLLRRSRSRKHKFLGSKWIRNRL